MQTKPPILRHFRHIRLNTSQAARLTAILEEIEAAGGDRPSNRDYETKKAELGKIPATKPTDKIPGTEKGVHGTERWPAPLVKLIPGTQPEIPEGLALHSLADSGGNHAVHNAASVAWTTMWNYWYALGEEGRDKIIRDASKAPGHMTN